MVTGRKFGFGGWMSRLVIRNLFEVDLVVTDHYPAAEAFDGGIVYHIAAGGKVTIRSTVFREQTIEHGEIQEIVVKRADGREMAPLVLSHVDFYQNRGRELLLEMGEDGVLSHRFVPRVGNGRRNLAQIIWNNLTIPFRGASRLHQEPVPADGEGVADEGEEEDEEERHVFQRHHELAV